MGWPDTLFSGWGMFLIVSAIVWLGQFVYATAGFGSGMVTISLLALVTGDVRTMVPFFLLLCLPTELTVAVRDRRLLDPKQTGTLLAVIAPGIVGGAWLLTAAPAPVLIRCLGVVIAGLALWFLLMEDRVRLRLTHRAWVPVVGGISGILGGLYGVSGPPLIVYFKSRSLNKRTFRAALLTIFLAMTCMRTVVYGGMGLLTRPVLLSALLCLPAAGLGTLTGLAAHHRIPEGWFRKFTSALLLISGLLLVARGA